MASNNASQVDLEIGTSKNGRNRPARPMARVAWWRRIFQKKPATSRNIQITGTWDAKKRRKYPYPPNIIRNQKYSPFTFLFVVLFNQFKYFFNLYFLIICVTQFIPIFRVTYIFTNIVPLTLVLTITIAKEAYDDIQRFRRDKEANSQLYTRLSKTGAVHMIPSSDIQVGDIIVVHKDQRVPADMVLLKTHDNTGTVFVRTDQLDGEIDWKLRLPVPVTQKLSQDQEIFDLEATVFAEVPHKDIHYFVGTFSYVDKETGQTRCLPLNVENSTWMNTVVASGSAYGLVIYTGTETRAAMNTSVPKTKDGVTDRELNTLSKILCMILVVLAISMVSLKGFQGIWVVYLVRFIVLFSTIIPLSLRVNLDLCKSVSSSKIMKDDEIPETIARTSTLPEELGRIQYLMSDKTGTLTMNDMEMKRIHLGTMGFGPESIVDLQNHIATVISRGVTSSPEMSRGRRDIDHRVFIFTLALAICHNVTPILDDIGSNSDANSGGGGGRSYQASSPDEIAIVKWTELVGISLTERDRACMKLLSTNGTEFNYRILNMFPFSSETKRMGILVQSVETGEVVFYQKGADATMSKIVQRNDWLDEECGNMAREGLRTLVIGRKRLAAETFQVFQKAYEQASVAVTARNEAMQKVVGEYLEHDLELLGITGVEDKLQDNVRTTLETLRHANIKIWMLTGDKVETAKCIANSSRLFSKNQIVHEIQGLVDYDEAEKHLDVLSGISGSHRDNATNSSSHMKSPFFGTGNKVLVIDGSSLQLYLEERELCDYFFKVSSTLPAVVCCRCTPTQKAEVARLLQRTTKKRVACIGDGGNDVSMIQAANVGIGIVGKEGRQASLAADFSITQFKHLTRLFLWHGRNSYKRTSKVSQFVIHRGFVIAIMQAVFSAILYFSPIALYQGILAVGYTTLFTMAPVFSLVLDLDITSEIALLYPELYADLTKARDLNFKTFFKWLMISTYQGGVLMILALWLFEREFIHIVSITFTALILNELLMIASEVHRWHWLMVAAEVFSILIYMASIHFLPDEFDIRFTLTLNYWLKVVLMTGASFAPLLLYKVFKNWWAPPNYSKLS